MGVAQAGEGVGKGIGAGVAWLATEWMKKKKEVEADDLVNRMAEQARQEAAATQAAAMPDISPIGSESALVEAAPSTTPVAASVDDPLETALAKIKMEMGEGQEIQIPTQSSAEVARDTRIIKTEQDIADRESFKDLIAREALISKAKTTERMKQNYAGSNLTQSIREARGIYDVDTPEYEALIGDLTNIAADNSLRNMAEVVSNRINIAGGNTTPDSIMAQGHVGVAAMHERFKSMPAHTKVDIIDEWGTDPITGLAGSRKIVVIAEGPDAGTKVANAGNENFVSHSSTQYTVDPNENPKAKARALADVRARNYMVFAETASGVIDMINPTTLSGGMVGLAREGFSALRTMTSLLRNQVGADGIASEYDLDNPPMQLFEGADFMNPETKMLLKDNAKLRSTYAHLAFMYYINLRPQAKSVSSGNLRNSLKAMGADLNDPDMMKATLRNLVRNMAIGVNVGLRGIDMSSYDSYGYNPHRPYNILSHDQPAGSAYAMDPYVVDNINADSKESSGIRPDEFSETDQVQGVIKETKALWHNTVTGFEMTTNQVLDQVAAKGYPGMTMEDIQLMPTSVLKEHLDLGMGAARDLVRDPLAPQPESPSAGTFTKDTRRALQNGEWEMHPGIIIKEAP